MKELESLLLRIAMPQGNSQKGKFAKAENLTRTLRQRVKKRQREDWLKLIGKEIDLIARETNGKRTRRPKGEEVVLAGVFEKTVTLRARYKRKDYRARVGRNGVIRFSGKTFNSPSSAGAAVRGRATNGWWLWKYERAPGQWVRLRELRNR